MSLKRKIEKTAAQKAMIDGGPIPQRMSDMVEALADIIHGQFTGHEGAVANLLAIYCAHAHRMDKAEHLLEIEAQWDGIIQANPSYDLKPKQ